MPQVGRPGQAGGDEFQDGRLDFKGRCIEPGEVGLPYETGGISTAGTALEFSAGSREFEDGGIDFAARGMTPATGGLDFEPGRIAPESIALDFEPDGKE